MRRPVAVATLATLALAAAASAQTWTEPKSGAAFPVSRDGMTLIGGGLRVKKMLFTFKAYALGFYVSDAALSGPLAAFRGQPASPELYKELQTGDFEKEVVLKFLRNISEGRIQGAMRESLEGADPKLLDQFISYFPEVKEGQECVLRVVPGGTLEVVMAGQQKPPIANRTFADRVMGLYVGPDPIQADIKAGVVARFPTGAAAGAEAVVEGTVRSVMPNGFTVVDADGKEWGFTVDKDSLILAKGAGHKMDRLKADGKLPTIDEFISKDESVRVKYQERNGKLVVEELRAR
jgi:hypothetical protein